LRRLKKNLAEQAIFSVADASSRVGGGAMPEQHLASRAIRIKPFSLPVSQLERRLRDQEIPLIGRIEDDHFIIDLRTVCDDELSLIHENLANVLHQ
jgi:L-seryl-tRNA(Ser) seleniumtransferase